MSTVASTLLEQQIQLSRAMLDGDVSRIAAAIEGDGIDPATRLGIHRNHVLTTFGAALKAAFPVVCRLVDERFFAYAAHEYLRLHPRLPRRLVEYGADFPDFLAGFEPCKDLPYLPDVARFEWALKTTATMQETSSLGMDALHLVPAQMAGYVTFRLQQSLRYFTSSWPVDIIWEANQHEDVPPTDLAIDGVCIEIRRGAETVVWQRLDPGSFAFRTALADGLALAAAITSAMQREPRFDTGASVHRLFDEGLVVGFRILSEEEATR